MPQFFVKPENALKRAQELLSVDKKLDALETLHDTIKARRHKTWTKTHEAIMLKHVELCVILRKPHMAKDALFQYKTLTQQVAVKSLETVIQHFLELAEQMTEDAQKTSIEKVEEIDDLDQADAPENLLLSAVSGAAAQDRMDRTVLSPWLRFLWDSYRNCLELLRNNAQVEQLYHKIARQSFTFCSKYQRRTEFRKLCEHLRMHLNQIQKHQHLQHGAESLTLMQETRLIQLDTAIQMELWQEAYRSAEDVHGMMQLSKDKDKRMVKPASYVNYYDKVEFRRFNQQKLMFQLALVYWKAGNRLFHAAALLQKYIIYKDMKKSFSTEEAQEQATRVLLATLSIPDGADSPSDLTRHLDIEDIHAANIRLLSNLLRLPVAPTRAGILKEIARLNLPDVAIDVAGSLYSLLETNFSPLRLAISVQEKLSHISVLQRPDYEQYVDSLRGVVATKALKQLSLIYDTLSLERIRKIVPFYTAIELERFLVNASKHRLVQAQIDHREHCVRFGAADATLAGGVEQETGDGFTGDDAQLGVEGIRGHLETMFAKLRDAIGTLDGPAKRKNVIDKLKHHSTVYSYHKKDDYERILMRRKKIEQYKESSERLKAEKSREAAMEQNKKDEMRRAEEMRRLEVERADFEKQRKLEEQEEIRRRINLDKIKKLKQSVIYTNIVKEVGEDAIDSMDPEQLLQDQLRRLDAERREQAMKQKAQEKKFDYTVRAFHLEEMKVWKSISDEYRITAEKEWEQYEKDRVAKAISDRENAKATFARMERVRRDAEIFLQNVKDLHKDEFKKKMYEWQSRLETEKRARLQRRKDQRIKARREEWEQQQELEKQRRKEEDEARVREEETKRRQLRQDRPQREIRDREPDESRAENDSNWRSKPMQQSLPPSRSSDGSRIENRAFNERISSIYPNRPVPAGATMRKEDDGISAADAGPWRRAQLKQSEPVEPTSTTQPAIDDSDRENMTRRFGPDRTVAPSERQRWQRGEQQPVPESAANIENVERSHPIRSGDAFDESRPDRPYRPPRSMNTGGGESETPQRYRPDFSNNPSSRGAGGRFSGLDSSGGGGFGARDRIDGGRDRPMEFSGGRDRSDFANRDRMATDRQSGFGSRGGGDYGRERMGGGDRQSDNTRNVGVSRADESARWERGIQQQQAPSQPTRAPPAVIQRAPPVVDQQH